MDSYTTDKLENFGINQPMIDLLKKNNALYFNLSKNYSGDYSNTISSIHFFSEISECNLKNKEVAYFNPDMHSRLLGELSGFNVCHRINGIDNYNLFKINW